MHPGHLQYRAYRSHGFRLAELIEVWEDDGAVVGFGFLHSDHSFCCQRLRAGVEPLGRFHRAQERIRNGATARMSCPR
jgi:hypothetical protein